MEGVDGVCRDNVFECRPKVHTARLKEFGSLAAHRDGAQIL